MWLQERLWKYARGTRMLSAVCNSTIQTAGRKNSQKRWRNTWSYVSVQNSSISISLKTEPIATLSISKLQGLYCLQCPPIFNENITSKRYSQRGWEGVYFMWKHIHIEREASRCITFNLLLLMCLCILKFLIAFWSEAYRIQYVSMLIYENGKLSCNRN